MAAPSEDTAQILEDAFTQAFSPPPSRRQSVIPTAKAPVTEEHASASVPALAATGEPIPSTLESSSATAEDTWKQEYEEQVKAWRAQSAEVREKAEKVREQWEGKRAAEREDAAKRKAAVIPEPEHEVIPGPQNTAPSVSSSTVLVAPAVEEEPVHVREHIGVRIADNTVGSPNSAKTGEIASRELQAASSTISQPDTVDGSQKWEELNSSTTSSYPSMTFPEQSTPPLEHQQPRHHHSHHDPTPAPSTATLSIFDSTLSTRTRLKAAASSVAINLLLPFVNGVMLGFGEIFAKNFILGWLGWGATATNVGISQRSRFGSRR